MCPNCVEILDKLDERTTADAHDGLRGGPVYSDHGATLERYLCGQCGTAWEYLHGKRKDKQHRPKWKVLFAGWM